jgi:hypothetical protein
VAKFPASVVQAHREVLMLPLLTRLVNDYSPKARAASGTTLRALLSQLDTEQVDQAVSFCMSWLKAGSSKGDVGGRGSQLRRAAAQALCAVADVEGPRFGKR